MVSVLVPSELQARCLKVDPRWTQPVTSYLLADLYARFGMRDVYFDAHQRVDPWLLQRPDVCLLDPDRAVRKGALGIIMVVSSRWNGDWLQYRVLLPGCPPAVIKLARDAGQVVFSAFIMPMKAEDTFGGGGGTGAGVKPVRDTATATSSRSPRRSVPVSPPLPPVPVSPSLSSLSPYLFSASSPLPPVFPPPPMSDP
jgi:hypothetical protein